MCCIFATLCCIFATKNIFLLFGKILILNPILLYMTKKIFLTLYNSMKKKRIPLKYLRKNEERCPACSGYGIIEESFLNNGFDACDVCEGIGRIEKEFVEE
mgnify:CR=1 FL=1